MKQTTKDIGDQGERLACSYLIDNGYSIRATNFRAGRAEIDIIAFKAPFLLFIEVKLRKSTQFGNPEEVVNNAKVKRIRFAAEAYMSSVNWQGPIRFDIIAISGKTSDIAHFEDCF